MTPDDDLPLFAPQSSPPWPSPPRPSSPPAVEGEKNDQAFSVRELSAALKRLVEGAFDHVRVRGELTTVKIPGSGHCYMTLKDDNAKLEAVCWRGTVNRLKVKPEAGLEVIVTGRITTYADRSQYQLVVEQMELAGAGALLKMLEERRLLLAKEGLFDEERKKPLPLLPQVIGVVTSPSGAVIRDILHRLAARFPRPVLIWPVPVQGEQAASEIIKAIQGFNILPLASPSGDLQQNNPVRPDLLIIARGGGSMEDLMAFNDAELVRAVAASSIPVISAIGHETDWTLIDYAADRRAPTPTAAAEMATPVKGDLIAHINELALRMQRAAQSHHRHGQERLAGWQRALPHPSTLCEASAQRFDERVERLLTGGQGILKYRAARLQGASERLTPPAHLAVTGKKRLSDLIRQAHTGINRLLSDQNRRLESQSERLEANSHRAVLNRGYVLMRDMNGKLVSDGNRLDSDMILEAQFRDTRVSVKVKGQA